MSVRVDKAYCSVCKRFITVMAFMGTGVCSIVCEKVANKEITLEEAQEHTWVQVVLDRPV